MVVELDQYLNRKEGREALSLKLNYICQVQRGEVPMVPIGMPINFFSYENSGIQPYLESRLSTSGIKASVSLTQKGRLTVDDTDIIFEGDV